MNSIQDIIKSALNFNNKVFYFPIRHHSPVCSYHLKKVINDYKPEIILIEMASTFKTHIPFIASKESVPPFAIYVSYYNKNEDNMPYKAMYPFLSYSPEYNAIIEGVNRNIDIDFIDLPYCDHIINSKIHSDDDDDVYNHSTYHQNLAKNFGLSSFDEVWNMMFEISGLYISTNEFLERLYTYCYYSRVSSDYNYLLASGDIQRENYMQSCILDIEKKYNKILVVTGGFHTIALAFKDKFMYADVKHTDIADDEKSYLVPYSFKETDMQFGYMAGMNYPYYYQKVWENITKNIDKPIYNTNLFFISKLAKKVKSKEYISLSDEIECSYMMQGLSEMRNKKESGLYELLDSVKSTFIKYDISQYKSPVISECYKMLTGVKNGKVDERCKKPPVLNDFHNKCKQYKLNISDTSTKKTMLNLYGNKEHIEKSNFLFQMEYIDNEFCKYISGYLKRGSDNRIMLREIWEYKYHSMVEPRLIDISCFGATVAECVSSLLIDELYNINANTETYIKIYAKAGFMGLYNIYPHISDNIEDVILNDSNIYSLCNSVSELLNIYSYNELMNKKDRELDKTGNLILNRIFTLLYSFIDIPEDDYERAAHSINIVYSCILDKYKHRKEEFLNILLDILNDDSLSHVLSGVYTGILLKSGMVKYKIISQKVQEYANYSLGDGLSYYLQGLTLTARECIFYNDDIIKALNQLIMNMQDSDFINILPLFRKPFTVYMPQEIDKIAKNVSQIFSLGKIDIYSRQNIEDYIDGTIIDNKVYEAMKKWGIYGE